MHPHTNTHTHTYTHTHMHPHTNTHLAAPHTHTPKNFELAALLISPAWPRTQQQQDFNKHNLQPYTHPHPPTHTHPPWTCSPANITSMAPHIVSGSSSFGKGLCDCNSREMAIWPTVVFILWDVGCVCVCLRVFECNSREMAIWPTVVFILWDEECVCVSVC